MTFNIPSAKQQDISISNFLCFLILQVNQSRRDAVYDLIVFILRMMTMIMTMWQYLCMMMVPYYLLHCTHSIVCTIRWDGMLEDDHHFNWTPLPRQLSSCYLSDSASCTLCCCVWICQFWLSEWSVMWYKWSEQIISEWLCDQWPCDDDKWNYYPVFDCWCDYYSKWPVIWFSCDLVNIFSIPKWPLYLNE